MTKQAMCSETPEANRAGDEELDRIVREGMLYATKGMSDEDKADIRRCAKALYKLAWADGFAAKSAQPNEQPVVASVRRGLTK